MARPAKDGPISGPVGGLTARDLFSLFQETDRIDRRGIFPHLEMQLGDRGGTAHAGTRDFLATLDGVAPLHLEFVGMAIHGHEATLVSNEDRIPEILQSVAGIDDDAILCRLDGRSLRHGDVDTVIGLAPPGSERGYHPATD